MGIKFSSVISQLVESGTDELGEKSVREEIAVGKETVDKANMSSVLGGHYGQVARPSGSLLGQTVPGLERVVFCVDGESGNL